MRPDVIDQLHRENPVPQDPPPLPFETILARIEADPTPRAPGKRTRRRSGRFGRVLSQAVALAAAVVAVVLLIEHGPSRSDHATVNPRAARAGLAVFERPQTARDRTLGSLVRRELTRSLHTPGSKPGAHVGSVTFYQPLKMIPSLTRYVETLPGGRQVFLSVLANAHNPVLGAAPRAPRGALPLWLTIVQPDGRWTHGQPDFETGLGFVDNRIAATEAQSRPNGCAVATEWSIEPNDVARVRWQFPRQDRYGYVYRSVLTLDVPVRGNLAIADIPGRASCDRPSVVTLYDRNGHVLHRTGDPAALNRITRPVKHGNPLAGVIALEQNPAHPHFPRNAAGQTYGSSANAGPPATEPDLIAVIGRRLDGTGHVSGYVLKSQFNAGSCVHVKSPAAAVRCNKAHAGKTHTIPVYARNGKTVIGSYAAAG